MNIKHEEYKAGKPQNGHRSDDFPGCDVLMDLRYFNKKSSYGDARSQPRPRFLTKHDPVWTALRVRMRDTLENYEVQDTIKKWAIILTEEISREFVNRCPEIRQQKGGLPYHAYCKKTEHEMGCFYLQLIDSLEPPKSKDMFRDQQYGLMDDNTETEKPIDDGWVYLITSPHDSNVKIGIAKMDDIGTPSLDSRVKEAQRHREGAFLYYAAHVSHYKAVEKEIHKNLESFKCEGSQRELFSLSSSQIKRIKSDLEDQAHNH